MKGASHPVKLLQAVKYTKGVAPAAKRGTGKLASEMLIRIAGQSVAQRYQTSSLFFFYFFLFRQIVFSIYMFFLASFQLSALKLNVILHALSETKHSVFRPRGLCARRRNPALGGELA